MSKVVDLLERPIYSMTEVDHVLALPQGTAKRWIDGYFRRGRDYPPVVRIEPTGEEIVTWGEFVEARLLAEYRTKGVPMVRMRPAIERLRDEFETNYPLATAKPFAMGKELVVRVQDQVELASALRMVEVARNGQLVLTEAAEHFWRSAEFDDPVDGIVVRIHPLRSTPDVVIDPLRQFGSPVVRSVRTEIIAEQFDAGDSVEMIAALYELDRNLVEAALRYERERVKAQAPTAA